MSMSRCVCVSICICVENEFVYKHLLVHFGVFACLQEYTRVSECVHACARVVVCAVRQMGNGPCAESGALCNVQP